MLNLNVTFALMENLVKVQKYMGQTSEDWTEEQNCGEKKDSSFAGGSR
jgi:hypothetical protein